MVRYFSHRCQGTFSLEPGHSKGNQLGHWQRAPHYPDVKRRSDFLSVMVQKASSRGDQANAREDYPGPLSFIM